MEVLFEVDTEYTMELYEDYYKTIANKINHFSLMRNVITAIFFVLAFGCSFLQEKWVCIVILMIAVAFPLMLTKKQQNDIRNTWNANPEIHGRKAKYKFYKTYIVQSNETGEAKCDYEKLYRILETEKAFYFLIKKNQGLMIDKKKCSDELRTFIRKISYVKK